MSHSYTYTERLNQATVELTLPDTREQAKELFAEIAHLAETDPVRWKAEVRAWTAADLYLCGLFCSWWQRRDGWTGRLEVDCDFQFEFARWVQLESDDALDFTARQHAKSTWRHTRIFQEVFRNPETTVGIFSFDLQKGARKHLVRWKTEAETNAVFKAAWDDVLYQDPREDGAFWSVENGCTVRRRGAHIVPTVSAYTFMKGLPTGARFSILYFDDVETEETVEAVEQRDKVQERFRSAINLGGRGTRVWMPGTFHHTMGLLSDLIKKGWKSHNFPAEDVREEAPDIAEIFDRFGGVRPDTGADIPEEVRSIRLAGAPVYLHPLECAILRFQEGNEKYEQQYMGNPLSGVVHRFRPEWVAPEMRIRADLQDFAAGKFGYLLSDPSKGLRDPAVGLMVAADSDKRLIVVDGFRRKLTPEQWAHEMYLLAVNWSNVMQIQQIRVEVFGQATWDTVLRQYFQAKRYTGAPIYGVGEYRGSTSNKKNDPGLMRAWMRLEPLLRTGRLRFPGELIVTNDDGNPYDLIRYFIDYEYVPFPQPATDDVLDCLSLLGVPEDKVPALVFPDRWVSWQDRDDEPDEPRGFMPGIEQESWLWQQ